MSARNNNIVTIGLFDSGVGGLSVLRQLEKLTATAEGKEYRFVYVGDTARCPYGNRESREVNQFVEEIIGWLLLQKSDHVVMACNTSAALSLDHAKRVSPVPVHNLIGPAAQYLAANHRKVGVLATFGTIKSRAFSRAVRAINNEVEVIEIACPDLVPLVENGFINGEQTSLVLSKYASQLIKDEVEAVVLGCTHFPFLGDALRTLLPECIELIDPARLLLKQFDSSFKLVDNGSQPAGVRTKMFVTGDVDSFANAAATCLGVSAEGLSSACTISGVSLEALSEAYDQAVAQQNISKVVRLPGQPLTEVSERSSING